MRLGVRAIYFTRNYPVEEAAERIAAYGLDGVAVPTIYHEYPDFATRHPAMNPAAYPEDAARHIVGAFRDEGLATWVVDSYNNISSPDSEIRSAAIAAMKGAIEAAPRFGCDTIVTESGRRGVGGFERCLDAFREFMPLAEEADITICVEPSYAQTVPNSWTMRGLIEEVGSPNLKVLLDPANILCYDDTSRPFDVLGEQIVLAHAKDCTVDEKGMPKFPAAGEGEVDWPVFIERLMGLGDIPLIIEYANEETMGQVLDFLRAQIAEVEGN
ncbi:MAG: sugar phosphate isomerase/epimerase family protein [Armatimonadota bacterium]